MEEKKSNPVREFLKRFWGLTPWMLEITIVFSYIINKMLDVYIIAGLLVLNAIIGYTQEEKASKAVELLKKSLQINSKVLRDGKWTTVKARYLVPEGYNKDQSWRFRACGCRVVKRGRTGNRLISPYRGVPSCFQENRR